MSTKSYISPPTPGMVPALADMFPQHGQRAVEEACARFPGSMEQAVEALLRLDLSGSGTSSTAAVAQVPSLQPTRWL